MSENILKQNKKMRGIGITPGIGSRFDKVDRVELQELKQEF
jgi:hypothetical protein